MEVRRLAAVGALAALGCGVADRIEASRPNRIDALPMRIARGEGWAVRVPESAKVVANGNALAVDAADGAWWFDVRTEPLTSPLPPVVTATRWAEERCAPIRWDLPATPVPGTWTAGGFCTIQGRDHWVEVAIEDRAASDGAAARRVLTGVVADRGRVPLEDLWVVFVDAALTVTPSGEPRPHLSADTVRERLRAVQQRRRTDGEERAQLPRPGGGTFSKAVSEALVDDVWRPRQATALPTAFSR